MSLPLQQYPLIQDNLAIGGINLKSAVTALKDNESPFCKNVIFSTTDAIQSRNGFSKLIFTPTGSSITGIYQLIKSDGTECTIFASGTNVNLFASFTSYTPIIVGQTSGALYDFSALNNYAFIVNGADPNKKYNCTTVYALGNPAPVTAATFNANIAGANLSFPGSYRYVYTFVNVDGEESNPSPASLVIPTIAVTQDLRINITVSADPQIVDRNIYRTSNGGASFLFVGNVGNNISLTFDDHISDANLGSEVEFDNDVPPILSMIETHKNRLFGVNPNDPSKLRISKEFNHDQWPALFTIDISPDDGDKITALVDFFDQLVIFKRKSIYILSGNNEIDFSIQRAQTDSRIGSINNRVPAVIGNKVYFLSERGVFSFDGLRINYESMNLEPIFDTARPVDTTTFNWAFESIACAINYKSASKNWYFLSIPTTSVPQNDFILVLDTVINAWVPFDGIKSNAMAIIESGNKPQLWSGDYLGFLWQQDRTDNDGFIHLPSFSTSSTNAINTLEDQTLALLISTATAGGAATLTDATLIGVVANQYLGQKIYINAGTGVGQIRTILSNTASPGVIFTVTVPWGIIPDFTSQYIIGGMEVNAAIGVRVKIIEGLGIGQIREIISNTPIKITIIPAWATIPDTTSRYSIGFIEKEWDTKWINYNDPDIFKRLVFEHINTSRLNQIGSTLKMSTFFDFIETSPGFIKEVSLAGLDSQWDVSFWDVNFWDTVQFIVSPSRMASGHIHRYVKVKLTNDAGGEPFTVNSLGLQYQQKSWRI